MVNSQTRGVTPRVRQSHKRPPSVQIHKILCTQNSLAPPTHTFTLREKSVDVSDTTNPINKLRTTSVQRS